MNIKKDQVEALTVKLGIKLAHDEKDLEGKALMKVSVLHLLSLQFM